MRAGAVLTLTLGLLASLATAVAGQNRVEIRGTVLDNQTDEPIAGVHLTVRNALDQALARGVTDDDGRFTVAVFRTSAVRIYAARIGYRRAGTPLLHFDGAGYFEVKVRLDPEAVLLAPLEVVARRDAGLSPVLDGFRHRSMRGAGHYITRADIERRRPVYVTDMLVEVPGVRIASSGTGARREVIMSRSEARDCAVQIYVDGLLVNRPSLLPGPRPEPFSIDDVVSPGSVEGIEVYRGLSSLPPEFYSPEAHCGVIAIWTRRGDTAIRR